MKVISSVYARVGAVFVVAVVGSIPTLAPAATPRFSEKTVVDRSFGPAPEQFGRAGIENTRKTRLVSCFAATAQVVAVPDRVKRDVKLFTASGVFDKAIPLVLTDGGRPDTVRARDVAIDGEALLVLVDDVPDGSKAIPAAMRIITYDMTSGQRRGVRILDTVTLSPPGGGTTARGADAYLLHPDGNHLWLVDSIRQMGFEIVLSGTSGAELAAHPVFGWGGSGHRFRTDDNASSINLLSGTGELERRLPESGVMVAVSTSGETFAVLQYIPIDDKMDWGITIYSAAGDRLGMAPRPNRSWRPFKAPIMERKYELAETPAGPELYELYANADGVRVVRWAR